MSLTTGTTAPNFSLFDTDKNQVHLADQKGKNVVLLFFPLAFTGVCTTELCSIRDNIAVYNNTSATVFGISVDSLFCSNCFFSNLRPDSLDFRASKVSIFRYFFFNFMIQEKFVVTIIKVDGLGHINAS